MKQQKVKVIIDPKGNFSFEAMEGFSGTSCIEQTAQLELVLGGEVTSERKKAEYWDPNASDPVMVKL